MDFTTKGKGEERKRREGKEGKRREG